MLAYRAGFKSEASRQKPMVRSGMTSNGQTSNRRTSNRRMMRNFFDALVAVLSGNAIYYLLMPHLPDVARHHFFREDAGLLVDFAICTVIFIGVKYSRRNEE
jgi:hypothetical protein